MKNKSELKSKLIENSNAIFALGKETPLAVYSRNMPI